MFQWHHRGSIGCMEVVLNGEDAADWIYRGEGAFNLVLSYAGTSPTFVGKVIRIQKTPRDSSKCVDPASILSTHECLLWKDIDGLISSTSKETAGQLFVLYVMGPLLGSSHLDIGKQVLVSKDFLESVEKNILYERPSWRVDAARVNTFCDSALLMSDHSAFPQGIVKEKPCISVELKPKCGFLPCSKFIAEGNAIKRSVARFRMHQILKLNQGEISQISEYDPLDLFSGSSERIHKAIKALFTTPQNNFRVFFNGSLIYGGLDGKGTSEAFEDMINGVIKADCGQSTDSFLKLVLEVVIRSGVLDRLLDAQKLDTIDIEGAIHAYYNIVSQPCSACKDLGGVSNMCMSLHAIPLEESLKIVRNYLIAATAKDCSMMISFRQREEDSESPYSSLNLDTTKQNFEYKVSFFDLDIKPLKRMEHYYKLDQKIVSCYTKMMKTKHTMDEAERIKGVKNVGIQSNAIKESCLPEIFISDGK